MPVWYAYRGDEDESWLWISAPKAFEVGRERTHNSKPYLEIDVDEFIRLRSAADFGSLYTQRLPAYKKLSTLPPEPKSPKPEPHR